MSDHLERLKATLADRYAIERELGSGGMATVYLALDLKHHRKVAVKVLRPDLAAALGSDRFLREIEIAAGLQHPHILPLHDSGESDGFLYYVMPFVEGESLRAKLDHEGELPVGDAVRILREVVDALAHAHSHGVVHRDIKPDNVMLSGRHAMVTDFGVAKAVSEATGRQQLTTAGVALGTPAYMAPEQAVADPHIDHRVDVYAVGALAYELLSGRPPFSGTTPQEVLSAHVTQAPQAVTVHRETVPPVLNEWVMKCLEKKPADRWQSAEEMLPHLEALATPSAGVTPTDTRPLQVAPLSGARGKMLAISAAVVVVAAIAFVLLRPSEEVITDPNVVAVLPFRVTGTDAQLRYLREGVVDLMHARLSDETGARTVAPQTAISAWRSAGASESEDLSEEASLAVAGRLGAGRLVLGNVVGTPARVEMHASLLSVPGGDVAAQATVTGPPDSLHSLIDQLTAELLAREAGEQRDRLVDLTTRSLPALRAYLEGQALYRHGRYAEASSTFEQALDEDSTFALAGLAHNQAVAWFGGPNPRRGLRLAWAARDRLPTRDRSLLEALVKLRGYPVPVSYAEVRDAMERAFHAAPDGPAQHYRLGDIMFHFGWVLGLEGAHQRARALLEGAIELDPGFAGPIQHLVELAAREGDVATARQLTERLLVRDSLGETAEYLRWRLAVAEDDQEALALVRQRLDEYPWAALGWIVAIGQEDGVALEDVVRAAELRLERAGTQQQTQGALWMLRAVALNRGRPSEAAALSQRLLDGGASSGGIYYMRISSALFWDADSSSAAEAIQRLTELSDEPPARDQSARSAQLANRCLIELWRVAHGDFSTVDDAISVFRRTPPGPDSTTRGDDQLMVCAVTLDALAAVGQRRPDAARAVGRLDSLSRRGPPGLSDWGNLALAQLLESQGDLDRALAATRRKPYFGGWSFLSSYLREEGRLAVLTGDREGAIRAYEHYLALRSDPEPALQPEVDRVRAELAKLVGEPGSP